MSGSGHTTPKHCNITDRDRESSYFCRIRHILSACTHTYVHARSVGRERPCESHSPAWCACFSERKDFKILNSIFNIFFTPTHNRLLTSALYNTSVMWCIYDVILCSLTSLMLFWKKVVGLRILRVWLLCARYRWVIIDWFRSVVRVVYTATTVSLATKSRSLRRASHNDYFVLCSCYSIFYSLLFLSFSSGGLRGH